MGHINFSFIIRSAVSANPVAVGSQFTQDGPKREEGRPAQKIT
jgi:hypothetical protein